MDLIHKLENDAVWKQYLNYKIEKGYLPKSELNDLTTFIRQKDYLPAVNHMIEKLDPGLPHIKEINKNGNRKKRIVFTFSREMNYCLKVLSFLLKDYDNIFSQGLYSFRKNTGVKKAIRKLLNHGNLRHYYAYKVDIHDYFNSVDTDGILSLIQEHLPEERSFYHLCENILRNPYAIKEFKNKNGETYESKISCQKGIMAGVPISGFLANLYLMELDQIFAAREITYLRYSDDILVFGENEEKISEYERIIKDVIYKKKLQINEKKEFHFMPGDPIEFLGFEFTYEQDNKDEICIDLSPMSIYKMKRKLKRKARALSRWQRRKGADKERTIRAYIRFLNQKFYENPIRSEITWSRWYYPMITTDDSLKIIDRYAIQCIRYLSTGRYNKASYRLRYEDIREMGFRSLVAEYWNDKKGV